MRISFQQKQDEPVSPPTQENDAYVSSGSESHSRSFVSPLFCGNVTLAFVARVRREHGDGVVRFAPVTKERTLETQIADLTEEQMGCVEYLRYKWRKHRGRRAETPDQLLLRFARNTPGEPFQGKTAWKILDKVPRRYWTLTARKLEAQLQTKTLFPLPGLRTLEGQNEVFYMRPSRFVVKEMATRDVIDNLVYVMNTLAERECPCTHGMGFLAYMNNWQMSNFAVDYCLQFMMMLQGRVGTRVTLFLIVNPPSWFGKIWKIMKPMLAPKFRARVHMIAESSLDQFLYPGFQQYLPDEMTTGTVPTDALVEDFINYRKIVEAEMSGIGGSDHSHSCTTSTMNMAERKLQSRQRALARRKLTLPRYLQQEEADDEPTMRMNRRGSYCSTASSDYGSDDDDEYWALGNEYRNGGESSTLTTEMTDSNTSIFATLGIPIHECMDNPLSPNADDENEASGSDLSVYLDMLDKQEDEGAGNSDLIQEVAVPE